MSQRFGVTARNLRPAERLLAAALLCSGLIGGYLLLTSAAPASYGPYACLPVSLQTLGPEDFPHGRATRFPDLIMDAAQRPAVPLPLEGGDRVSGETLFVGPESGHYGFAEFTPPSRRRGLVNFTHGLVSIETMNDAVPLALLRHSPIPNMALAPDLFHSDMFTPADYAEGDIPPLLCGEEMDENGRPARWGRPADAIPGLMACSRISSYGSDLFQLLRNSRITRDTGFSGQAGRYRTMARRYAEKYNLAFSLVLAIMHTESNFNPYAVSRSQAVGLMQIVPETAGHEVYRYLTGLPGQPNPEVLFSPEHNIKYGAIYLHLLDRRYFGDIINPRTRQMCIIAAYNGGPGAVLRLFDSAPETAVNRINALTPDDVYKTLVTDMPNAETRRYVELVLGRIQSYASF